MENITNINWYPGHMTKARRMMEDSVKLVDIVIEVLDARIPFSSKNPDIDKLAKNKFRLVILNKADAADPQVTDKWIAYYKEKGFTAIKTDARNRKDVSKIPQIVRTICKDKIERDRKRGILNRPIKAMIAGIPNSGKSTFINSLAGKASAKTGNKPGVTRGKQWIRVAKDIDLLDTPGILWPKFEDPSVGMKLSYIGSINDEVVERHTLCLGLLELLQKYYCNMLSERYTITEDMSGEDALRRIADVRKCLLKGAELDIEKAERILFDDFRSGKLGRATLDYPEDVR
ncbi:MAG: ribosome biogenesis GTPase YlqF [Eubacterium sp.]|nr:ribosome biogenesis GTPase YlqF [Eubacterium sp.]